MQNFTAIPNPASYFGYNHLLRSYSALRNAMIETLKMPKIAKLPRLNSANDAQIRKKFRFFHLCFQAILLGRTFSNLSQKFEQNGIFGIYPKFFFQDLCVFLC